MSTLVAVSVVSHGQNRMVNQLLADIDRNCSTAVELVVTENIPDGVRLEGSARFPMRRIVNRDPKGFGANHNAAFKHCRAAFFCVLNPDVRMNRDPFPQLTAVLSDAGVALTGPMIRTSAGHIEDSARRFPTLLGLGAKLLRHGQRGPDYPTDAGPVRVDWIAGMCMVLKSGTYAALGGFDERYFLYYEDIDLCRRAGRRGLAVVYEPRALLIHDAQRASRRHPRLALHHALSMARYFLSTFGKTSG